jgi:hypothetical protein
MCDAEMPKAYHARLVRARLPHDCESCPHPIMPGEQYHLATGVWDGEGRTYKRHQLCAVLEEQTGECGCWAFGALREVDPQDFSWVFQRAWKVVMGRPVDEESRP